MQIVLIIWAPIRDLKFQSRSAPDLLHVSVISTSAFQSNMPQILTTTLINYYYIQ